MNKKNYKIATCALAIALAAVTLASAIGFGKATDGFRDWSAFKQEQIQQGENVAGDGGLLIEGEEQASQGMKLVMRKISRAQYDEYGIDGQSVESAYTITVTHNSDALNPKFTWTTSGTTLKLAPSADTKSCVVTCSGAFGTQQTITCTAQDNPSATASCTVDYIKRPTDASLKLTNSPDTTAINFTGQGNTATFTLAKYSASRYDASTSSGYDKLVVSSFTPVFGTGTITETYTLRMVRFQYDVDEGIEESVTALNSSVATERLIQNATDYDLSTAENAYQVYKQYNSATNPFLTDVILTFVGDRTGEEFTFNYTLNVDVSKFYVTVGNVDLDKDSIVF